MSSKRWTYVAIAVLLAGTLVGCSRARNDAQIAGEVLSRIQSDANVPTKQILVTSNNGVVTLAGTVSSEMERMAAANDAASVEGVKTVVNNLQVAPSAAQMMPPPMEGPPAQVYEQPRRTPVTPRRSTRAESDRARIAPPAPAEQDIPVSAPVRTVAPPPRTVEVPAGTALSIRMIDAVDTSRNQVGDSFRATLSTPIYVGDEVVVPQGADVEGRIAELKSAGRFAGQSQLALELETLSFNGRRYNIQTSQYTRQGTSRGKRTAATIGGGAALGAIIGGIAGGGKGAAIGATVGAGAGTGVQAATKGQQIQVKSESILRFQLESPITVTPASSADRRGGARMAIPNQEENLEDETREFNQSDSPQAEEKPPVLRRRPQ